MCGFSRVSRYFLSCRPTLLCGGVLCRHLKVKAKSKVLPPARSAFADCSFLSLDLSWSLRIWLGGFLLKHWPWVLCQSAMLADEEWAWGLSRKTITVLAPSPTTFQLDTLLSASRAFRAVSAAAGSPARGILKRVTDQTVASNFNVRPEGCTASKVWKGADPLANATKTASTLAFDMIIVITL